MLVVGLLPGLSHCRQFVDETKVVVCMYVQCQSKMDESFRRVEAEMNVERRDTGEAAEFRKRIEAAIPAPAVIEDFLRQILQRLDAERKCRSPTSFASLPGSRRNCAANWPTLLPRNSGAETHVKAGKVPRHRAFVQAKGHQSHK